MGIPCTVVPAADGRQRPDQWPGKIGQGRTAGFYDGVKSVRQAQIRVSPKSAAIARKTMR